MLIDWGRALNLIGVRKAYVWYVRTGKGKGRLVEAQPLRRRRFIGHKSY
jgi:hypothetical protein